MKKFHYMSDPGFNLDRAYCFPMYGNRGIVGIDSTRNRNVFILFIL